MDMKAKPVRECEDCEEVMKPNERRSRCRCCGLLVCGWCIHHVHNKAVQDALARSSSEASDAQPKEYGGE
jgi:hypothetical protein